MSKMCFNENDAQDARYRATRSDAETLEAGDVTP